MVSPRFCGQRLRGRVCWHSIDIPTVLQSTSSWPSLVARQWYPQGFAVNFFVAEFGGTAVVSPRFLQSPSSWPSLPWYPHGFAVNIFVAEFGGTAVVPPRFCGRLLRGRVWWHRSGIPTVFAVTFFVAEFGGTAVVPPRFSGYLLRGRVPWHRSGIPRVLQSISSWLSLVPRQWNPHGFAVNFFVANRFFCRGRIPAIRAQPLHGRAFSTAVASPRFAVNLFMAAPSLLRWHPRGSRMGLIGSSRPLLLMLVAAVCVDGSDWHLEPLGRR